MYVQCIYMLLYNVHERYFHKLIEMCTPRDVTRVHVTQSVTGIFLKDSLRTLCITAHVTWTHGTPVANIFNRSLFKFTFYLFFFITKFADVGVDLHELRHLLHACPDLAHEGHIKLLAHTGDDVS